MFPLYYECLDGQYNCLGHFYLNIATTTPNLPYDTKRIYVIPRGGKGYCGQPQEKKVPV